MFKMTPDEVQLVKKAIGLFETDSKSFAQQLMRLGGMTREGALKLFEKAINARVIQEDRGRVRMAPPPPDPRAISDSEIRALQQAGYSVYMASDGTPSVYAWRHRAGASQSDFKHLQPFRLTQAQAWADCSNYARGAFPTAPERDWLS
jgi:hypothetical protein